MHFEHGRNVEKSEHGCASNTTSKILPQTSSTFLPQVFYYPRSWVPILFNLVRGLFFPTTVEVGKKTKNNQSRRHWVDLNSSKDLPVRDERKKSCAYIYSLSVALPRHRTSSGVMKSFWSSSSSVTVKSAAFVCLAWRFKNPSFFLPGLAVFVSELMSKLFVCTPMIYLHGNACMLLYTQ